MEDRERKALIELEDKMIRRLRFLVNLTFATIAQDDSLTLEQAWEHVLALKGAAVAMFPGKEDTFDLLYMPRFSRLLAERYGANSVTSGAILMRTLAGRIVLPDGSIVAGVIRFGATISSIERTDAGPDYLLPGFVDLQVNGSHGIDVMGASADGIIEISHQLAREGTTSWLPTAITSPIDRIEKVHRAIAEAIDRQRRNDLTGAKILGMHLEGPFISPMRLGAHPKLNLEPRGEAFERVMALEHLKLVTLAPELPGAIDAIHRLTARGVVVSLGHTNATFEEATAGVAAGARMFTHLFNAMRPLNHRDPGVIAAALTNEVAMPAVIPDGVHVAPEILRLIYMARGARRMILTTDKVSLARSSTKSTADGAARLPDGTLAGALISMLAGARLMTEKAGAGIGEVAMMAASNPATVAGHPELGRLQHGAVSDIIVLNEALELKAVFLAGRELK